MTILDESLWAARREHARRWVSTDLRDYPALPAQQEAETTLAAVPTKQAEKRLRASE
jgi:hypothetical protein